MERSVFLDDVIERSIVARSAKHTKGKGGKAIHAKLPCDFMTNAQIKKMNGPVESYHLGKPMSWDAFKALPDSMKKEYMGKLINKFGGSSVSIAKMFCVSDIIIRNYARTLGVQFPRGVRTKENCAAWDLFLSNTDSNGDASKSDTAAQAQEIDLNRVMTWKEFLKLPDSTKKAYLTNLMHKHGGSSRAIAKMFGVSDQTVRRHAHALSVKIPKGKTKKQFKAWDRFLAKNAAPDKLNTAAAEPEMEPATPCEPMTESAVADEPAPVQEIAAADPAPETEPESVEAPVEEPIQDSVQELEQANAPTSPAPAASVAILSGTITFDGPASACLEQIAAFLGDKNYSITVQWTVAE